MPAVLGAWARTGSDGHPVAGAYLESSYAFALDYEALRRPDLLRRPVRRVSHTQLGRALTEWDDPPVKALLIMANNPAVTCPDAGRVRRGLEREDLFVVVHDSFMTDTAALADLVLPATTSMESEDVYRSYGHLYIQYARPVIPPVGESRSNAWVVRQLAARFGLDDEVFRRDVAGHVRALLAGQPEELVERVLSGQPVKVPPTGGPGRWRTASGRISFVPPPDFMADTGPPRNGTATRPAGDTGAQANGAGDHPGRPAGAAEAPYPLRLLTAPGAVMSHTGFEAVATLRRRAGAPVCLLHPEDARARGIADGQPVIVFNERGHVGLRARVTGDTQPGLVVVEGTRATRAYLSGGPLNVLTADRMADMGEGATYQSTWVDVRPLP
ncbi:MAG: molybdopterin-dependent oxidoreductase [Limnochordaceae bacterium]|nr:molybdopterin-dependent oxidoreductase [Limnochordaceae bacterium]